MNAKAVASFRFKSAFMLHICKNRINLCYLANSNTATICVTFKTFINVGTLPKFKLLS